MVNGYTGNTQFQPQVYQGQQQSQVQVADFAGQGTVQNPQFSNTSPYTGSTSGVNINIISPSVYGPNRADIPYAPIYNYPAANSYPAPPIPPAAQPVEQKEAPKQNKPKTKDIVPLTDEYIMTLENYIKSPNEQVRMMGAKQILARFKEDDSRRSDAALTALLNMTLQDKSDKVRVLGMTTIAAGYSAGDDKTAVLLDKLQHNSSNYNEDALLAANALMKMSGKPQKVEDTEN